MVRSYGIKAALTAFIILIAMAAVLPLAAQDDTTAELGGSNCDNPNHPVASSIAEEFGVSYDDVMAMHCDGNGFGEITRAYLLAAQTGESVQSFLDRRAQGEGWGQILQESGVHPSDLAPGHVIGRGHGKADEQTEAPELAADPAANEARSNNERGNGNGNGNGGGNGNSGGSGNSGGNGNGRGNN